MVDVMRGVRLRLQMNKFLFLYNDKTWFDAVALVHRFVDGHIDKTLEQLRNSKTANSPAKTTDDERNDLLWVMAKQLQDKKALRSQILAVFVPSNDTTSILISNAFYALARHPEVWEKLREEVKSIGHTTLNFESLRSLRYLNWVLNESECSPTVTSFTCADIESSSSLVSQRDPNGSHRPPRHLPARRRWSRRQSTHLHPKGRRRPLQPIPHAQRP